MLGDVAVNGPMVVGLGGVVSVTLDDELAGALSVKGSAPAGSEAGEAPCAWTVTDHVPVTEGTDEAV